MKKIISSVVVLMLLLTMGVSASAIHVEYEDMGVPNVNSSFKAWMDYRACAWGSTQRNFSEQWAWTDSEGFMRCTGERDFGINDDYYLIALGSYYGTTIGTKYRITTNTGNVFYGALGDMKDNRDTNRTNQYSDYYNVVEFLVHTPSLRSDVKKWGSANVYMPLNGSIAKIEKMNFVWD